MIVQKSAQPERPGLEEAMKESSYDDDYMMDELSWQFRAREADSSRACIRVDLISPNKRSLIFKWGGGNLKDPVTGEWKARQADFNFHAPNDNIECTPRVEVSGPRWKVPLNNHYFGPSTIGTYKWSAAASCADAGNWAYCAAGTHLGTYDNGASGSAEIYATSECSYSNGGGTFYLYDPTTGKYEFKEVEKRGLPPGVGMSWNYRGWQGNGHIIQGTSDALPGTNDPRQSAPTSKEMTAAPCSYLGGDCNTAPTAPPTSKEMPAACIAAGCPDHYGFKAGCALHGDCMMEINVGTPNDMNKELCEAGPYGSPHGGVWCER
jgi:hypothetical protein